jgi:hypothetical protein
MYFFCPGCVSRFAGRNRAGRNRPRFRGPQNSILQNMLLCCFAGCGCGICSAPRGFVPQTADAGQTKLTDGVSNMGGLLELLLA